VSLLGRLGSAVARSHFSVRVCHWSATPFEEERDRNLSTHALGGIFRSPRRSERTRSAVGRDPHDIRKGQRTTSYPCLQAREARSAPAQRCPLGSVNRSTQLTIHGIVTNASRIDSSLIEEQFSTGPTRRQHLIREPDPQLSPCPRTPTSLPARKMDCLMTNRTRA